MKRFFKEMICMLLVLCLVLSYLPADAGAFAMQLLKPNLRVTESVLIPDVYDPDQRIRILGTKTERVDSVPLAEGEYLTDPAQAGAMLRETLVKRGNTHTLLFEADASLPFGEVIESIRQAARVHTGQPTEGDYLTRQGLSIGADGSYYPGGATNKYTIVFNITYYTTAEQENQMDTAVEALLDSLDLDGKSDYEKICAVYDWMCANITYDYTNLEDDTYKLKYTAYAALINRTSVCQGYAVLLYRLMLELGIDCRVIAGTGNGGGHAWNIVKLNGKYYNLDATWDSSWHQAGLEYNYFLRSNDTFGDHVRNEEFDNAEFNAAYPMSDTDYAPNFACSHNYTSTVTAPTCTAQGYTTHSCTVCGDSYVDSYVEAKGHTEVIDAAVAPTCTTTGLTEGKHCSVCNVVLVAQTEVAATDHSYGQWYVVTQPGEYTDGLEQRDCGNCGHSETRAIPAVGHTHSYQSQVTAPTCTEQGFTTHTCACGDSYVDSYVAATGHTYGEWYIVSAATCTTDGQQRRDCANCEHYETEVVLSAGHSYASVVTAPTCTAQGYTTHTCTVCGDSYVDSYVEAKGHTEVIDAAVAPTCTTTGLTEGKHCSVCNVVLVAQTEVAATDHSYGQWYVVTQPGEYTDGLEQRDCGSCGHSETRAIPAVGHVHSYEEVVTDPTCTVDGTKVYTCRCGDTYTETIPATGHTYSSKVTAPTCTEDGYTTHTCSGCGHSYTDAPVAATGHHYEAEVTEPTCTQAGKTTYTCRCGDTYTEQIPATGHSFVDGTCAHCGASESVLGDVNGDGKINARDARALLRYIAGLAGESEINLAAADFNGDGKINARDARALLRSIAGLD